MILAGTSFGPKLFLAKNRSHCIDKALVKILELNSSLTNDQSISLTLFSFCDAEELSLNPYFALVQSLSFKQ